jgi:hypothetical protein
MRMPWLPPVSSKPRNVKWLPWRFRRFWFSSRLSTGRASPSAARTTIGMDSVPAHVASKREVCAYVPAWTITSSPAAREDRRAQRSSPGLIS